ncbi:unnamed protein product [Blepharisma stoltei]|uniref:Uncharacterized protein n=1 Tax=Blepharisma stoltei TaxID=1481888 RepID=A0AAU9J093_9CILI|nr:unnamed protein product [Blepharisma stoltei]
MSIFAWLNPIFWYQLKFFSPHKLNGKWFFIKREFCLPYNIMPQIEDRDLHLRWNPTNGTKIWRWIWTSSLWRRFMSQYVDFTVGQLKRRGGCISDMHTDDRLKIRFPVYAKNRDPYYQILMEARNTRARNWRTWGMQVPEKQGPGPNLGLVKKYQDYDNKIFRMADDDWTYTGLDTFFLAMLPNITLRKYWNEFPRVMPYFYGMYFTKEQLFNHISFGVDPGNQVLDELINSSDPEKKAEVEEDNDIMDYLFPIRQGLKDPNYRLKYPFPDDNIYRPTFNRGGNRQYWSRDVL